MAFTDLSELLARPFEETTEVAVQICADLVARIDVLVDLGLGYLSLGRSHDRRSRPARLQRLRLATQLRSGLFGVVYVLDEPSAGLHPADAEPLLDVLERLRASGNSLFVVEHDMDIVRRADWVVDVGPGAGEAGARPLQRAGRRARGGRASRSTRRTCSTTPGRPRHEPREPTVGSDCARHPQQPVGFDVDVPARRAHRGHRRVRSGKSTLVTQVLGERRRAPPRVQDRARSTTTPTSTTSPPARRRRRRPRAFDRLVRVDQQPIGRTPRSNLATYTGMFDPCARLFAATDEARRRG